MNNSFPTLGPSNPALISFITLVDMALKSDSKYADLQACCVCLGFLDEKEYKVDVDAAASIRSILRYLRNESASCDIRRELGNLKILTSDLIPLLKVSRADPILFDLVVRLMVSLTQPAVVCFHNEIPNDRDLHAAFLKVDAILKEYKHAFADEQLFRVLAECVEDLFNKPWEDRSNDDRLLIERILILIRNVLHISPDATTEHRTDDDVSVHDQLLWTIHLSGWDDLLLFLANAKDELNVFAFHILEITSLMLREKTPEQLASAGSPLADIDPSIRVLERCRLKEQEEKRAALVRLNMRHNRFGGTFELLNTQSISCRPLIYHHDVTVPLRRSRLICAGTSTKCTDFVAIDQVDLDLGKRIRRKPCSRKPLIEREFRRRSALSVQLFLQKFCWQFLCNCYNLLMHAARGAILRQSTQANDETYYLWSMRFFMAFCRLYRFRPQYLSESLNANVFNWVYTLSMGYREALLTDRRGGARNQNALQYSRRLALAVSAHLQFLLCLQEMFKPSKKEVREKGLNGCRGDDEEEEEQETLEAREHRLRVQKQVAESLMSNIFYVAEYQDLFVSLLKEYNESTQSKEYLIELVEGAHLFINLLTAQAKSMATFIVSRHQRRRHRSEKRRLKYAAHRERRKELVEARKRLLKRANETFEERSALLARIWIPLSSNLISALSGTPQIMSSNDDLPQLFDPADVSADGESMAAQLRNAIRLVHTSLHDNQATRSLAIARSMWDIWPEASPCNDVEEEDEEAKEDLAKEKARAIEAGLEPPQVLEYLALRKIFLLDLTAEELAVTEAAIQEETWNIGDAEESFRQELEDSDDEHSFEVLDKEVAFDIHTFLLRFTHPHIIRSLTCLLANYALNPPLTNTHLVYLLHKIAVKQHLPGILFQLRLFYIFQTIIKDPVVEKLEEFKEMLFFIKYILRKFFATFKRSHLVGVEALFLKSTREAAEAYSGYGTYESGHKKLQWTAELDKELDQLFEACRYDPVPKGEDLVDVLKRNLSDPGKTRRQIIMRLIHLGKVASAKNLKMMTIHLDDERVVGRSRERRPLRSEEEVNLLNSFFLKRDSSSYRLDDVMAELRPDFGQRMRQESSEMPTAVIWRSRQEAGEKFSELGLAGHHRRQTRHQGRVEEEIQLETLGGGISRMKKVDRSSRGRRRRIRRHDSSPELLYDANEHFSNEVYQEPANPKDIHGANEEEPPDSKRPGRSIHLDLEDSSEEDSDMFILKTSVSSHPTANEDRQTVNCEKRRRVALEYGEGGFDDFSNENLLDREIIQAIQEAENMPEGTNETGPRRTCISGNSDEDS
ncbi:timeless [Echinococcus multilocularis]|uniref:Timeless n=1 Tax=Echinococcus multilocularis TaxID=6211 RepID=A0A087VXA9_ECHMU|nr:timeless [Echinococcus multilocularis]